MPGHRHPPDVVVAAGLELPAEEEAVDAEEADAEDEDAEEAELRSAACGGVLTLAATGATSSSSPLALLAPNAVAGNSVLGC